MSRPRELIIDTNLLLLLVIGSLDEGSHIRNSNRLNKFSRSDYDLLLKVMSTYQKGRTTKYIATEVSNLIDLKGSAKIRAFEVARLILTELSEIETDLQEDLTHTNFINFGITDSTLISLAPKFMILTDDERLCPLLFAASPENIITFETVRALGGAPTDRPWS